MKIRFRCLTDSDAPGFPFLAGQTIEVAALTPTMKRWLQPNAAGVVHAELVREDDETELATVGVAERAVVRTKRSRKG
jgi:hypothetical protein